MYCIRIFFFPVFLPFSILAAYNLIWKWSTGAVMAKQFPVSDLNSDFFFFLLFMWCDWKLTWFVLLAQSHSVLFSEPFACLAFLEKCKQQPPLPARVWHRLTGVLLKSSFFVISLLKKKGVSRFVAAVGLAPWHSLLCKGCGCGAAVSVTVWGPLLALGAGCALSEPCPQGCLPTAGSPSDQCPSAGMTSLAILLLCFLSASLTAFCLFLLRALRSAFACAITGWLRSGCCHSWFAGGMSPLEWGRGGSAMPSVGPWPDRMLRARCCEAVLPVSLQTVSEQKMESSLRIL